MTADELRDAIERTAATAMKLEPLNTGDRARLFVAGLSGALACTELELSEVVWSVINQPVGANLAAQPAQGA